MVPKVSTSLKDLEEFYLHSSLRNIAQGNVTIFIYLSTKWVPLMARGFFKRIKNNFINNLSKDVSPDIMRRRVNRIENK